MLIIGEMHRDGIKTHPSPDDFRPFITIAIYIILLSHRIYFTYRVCHLYITVHQWTLKLIYTFKLFRSSVYLFPPVDFEIDLYI